MVNARSLFGFGTFGIDFGSLPVEQERAKPKKYVGVVLSFNPVLGSREIVVGDIVTTLRLDHYCEKHGYTLITPPTLCVDAESHERTNLALEGTRAGNTIREGWQVHCA